ncbi:MAG: hypothetical protein AAFY84_18305 [Pseudomonadota bacterium]
MGDGSEDEDGLIDNAKSWIGANWQFVLLRFFLGFASFVVGVVVAATVTIRVFEAYLDERDRRLDDLKSVTSDYRDSTNASLRTLTEEVRRDADFSDQIARDVSDVRERVARMEAALEGVTSVLLAAQQPEIEREFLPILRRTSPTKEVGGPGGEPVDGFDPMVRTIPNPRSVEERSIAVEELIAAHRTAAIAQGTPQFDETYDFEIIARQVLLIDGSIQLEITSTIVRTDDPQ